MHDVALIHFATHLPCPPQVVDAVQTGKLSHIFLVGGCDGHEPQRDYYSKLGQVLPKDTMVRKGKAHIQRMLFVPFDLGPVLPPSALMPLLLYRN